MTQTTPSGRRGWNNESPLSQTVVWLTPPYLLNALGPFDLDPCAAVGQPWRTATRQFTITDDGLAQLWSGFVWCNPPFGRGVDRWLARMAIHGSGIALVPARTDTKWFRRGIWNEADGVLFLDGRMRFHRITGEPGAGGIPTPIALVAYGAEAVERLRRAGLAGTLVSWEKPPPARALAA